MKILIIEDNPDLAYSIEKYLSGEGYTCELSATTDLALQKIELYDYECILLDIMLPDGSGFSILERLKQLNKQEGVIIISAKDSLDDKIKGLGLGADDYLTKPFHLAELAMRVLAVIRRRKFNGNNLVRYEKIEMNMTEKTVFFNDVQVEQLSPKEFDLLSFFISSPKRVLSKGSIAEHLLGDNADMLDNFDFVYAHVKNLKKKLKQAGCSNYIHTIYGMGYKFEKK
jgi:DNA-binding response OmpR family regulator